MEIELAHKLQDMDYCEILDVLMKLRIQNHDAYAALKELIDDL